MAYKYDILLKNGIVADYATDCEVRSDLGILDGKIVEIALKSIRPMPVTFTMLQDNMSFPASLTFIPIFPHGSVAVMGTKCWLWPA